MHLFYEKKQKKHGCIKASLKLCISKISCKCKKALKKNYCVKLIIIVILGRNQERLQPLTCNYSTHFIS